MQRITGPGMCFWKLTALVRYNLARAANSHLRYGSHAVMDATLPDDVQMVKA